MIILGCKQAGGWATHEASGGPQYVPDAAPVAQPQVERGHDAHDEGVATPLAHLAPHRHKAWRPLGAGQVVAARGLARGGLVARVVVVCGGKELKPASRTE